MANLFLAKKCIYYWLTSRHKRGFGIHSPFLFNLITKGFRQDDKIFINNDIENIYKSFFKNNTPISLTPFGAGSKVSSSLVRSPAQIVKNEVMPLKYRILLSKLINYFNSKNIIELGTSLGITTAYIAAATKGNIITVEGEPNIHELAKQTFSKLGLKNITAINSSFDDFLANNKLKYDFVVIDGNHTYEATVKYFNILLTYTSSDTVWIFDDIYWSEGMAKAWQYIIKHLQTTLTLDLCRMGIAFTNQRLSKQYFMIRY